MFLKNLFKKLPIVVVNSCVRQDKLCYTEVIVGTKREVFQPEKWVEQNIYIALVTDELGDAFVDFYTTDLDKGFNKILVDRERVHG